VDCLREDTAAGGDLGAVTVHVPAASAFAHAIADAIDVRITWLPITAEKVSHTFGAKGATHERR
jgi:CO/xanthine dehydrogenase Mo-binding subunit